VAAIGFPLLADSGNWHTATNLFQMQREAYSRYWINSSKPIAAISSLAYRYQLFAAGAPLNWISHIDGLSAAKTCFSRFKEPVPFKIFTKISAVQCETKSF
jgi:hypothetical protein